MFAFVCLFVWSQPTMFVISVRVFLMHTSTKQELMCLAQGHDTLKLHSL